MTLENIVETGQSTLDWLQWSALHSWENEESRLATSESTGEKWQETLGWWVKTVGRDHPPPQHQGSLEKLVSTTEMSGNSRATMLTHSGERRDSAFHPQTGCSLP